MKRGFGWLMVAISVIANSLVAAAEVHLSREDIEWLDVWLPHVNDLDKPHVLLIGDSITRDHYPVVEAILTDQAYVGRLSTSKSLGDPALLAQIAQVLKEGRYRVIHFNNGLHGSGYSESEYVRALSQLIALFRDAAPKARLIWGSSTNLLVGYQGDHPSLARMRERNRLAADCVSRQGIPLDDLYVMASQHPEYHLTDGVHFTQEGNNMLGHEVADSIKKELHNMR